MWLTNKIIILWKLTLTTTPGSHGGRWDDWSCYRRLWDVGLHGLRPHSGQNSRLQSHNSHRLFLLLCWNGLVHFYIQIRQYCCRLLHISLSWVSSVSPAWSMMFVRLRSLICVLQFLYDWLLTSWLWICGGNYLSWVWRHIKWSTKCFSPGLN